MDICRRNGIKRLLWKGDKSLIGQVDKQNMTVHRWFAAKACPGDWLYSRHGQIADEVNAKLSEEDEDMDQTKFNEMFSAAMTDYLKGLQNNNCGDWSQGSAGLVYKRRAVCRKRNRSGRKAEHDVAVRADP